jgi:hypothetical protein
MSDLYTAKGGECGAIDSQQIEVASSSGVETLANDRIAQASLLVRSQADCKCRSCSSLRQRGSNDLIGYTSDIVGLKKTP